MLKNLITKIDNISSLCMGVTGHLYDHNKELQGKDKVITDMSDDIKAFKVKFRLWQNQLKCLTLFTSRT
jgi:hypothetical protein